MDVIKPFVEDCVAPDKVAPATAICRNFFCFGV
jgi:hypothetical protein